MKPQSILAMLCALFTTLILSGCVTPAVIILNPQSGSTQMTTGVVSTHPARGDVKVVPGASAALVSDETSVTVSFSTTDLVPGHIYTAWWIIYNNPDACDSGCGPDYMLDPELNQAVQGEVMYGTGRTADENGQATFTAVLYAHDRQGWFQRGLTNPRGAEIFVALHDHGPAIAGLENEMLGTFRAGCTDASLPARFPPAAFADGTPGPNDCIHYQFTVFQQ